MEKSIDELPTENSNLHVFYRRILENLTDEYRNKDSERIAKERRDTTTVSLMETTLKKEERKMNAVTARLLIWYYYSVDAPPDNDSVSIQNAYHFLIVKSLIEKDGNSHVITEKGKVLVEYWLSTPIPIEQTNYVIPDRK